MKARIVLLGCLSLMFLASCAPGAVPAPPSAPTPLPSPSPTPFPYAGQTLKDVTYCSANGVALKMDLYFPASGGPWPAVVYVHGGAWMKGDKSDVAGLGAALAREGYLAAAVNYRLYPLARFPAYIQDVKCAVRSLRAHAAEYNLDPARVGAIGESAGGHLVALLGTSDRSAGFDVGEYLDQSSRVQAVIDLSGPTDLTQVFPNSDIATLVLVAFGRDQQAAASSVTYVTPDDPPFLIVHGDSDGVIPVEQSHLLYDRLARAGVPASLVIVKNGGHTLTSASGDASPTLEQIWGMELDFLKAKLK